MALEGTLRDFSLADIFQLIGLQRKTGVLTLRAPEDVVSISFLDGRIVGADSVNKRLEDRLGQVLIKTGRATQELLDQALKEQMETLERLGHVLIRRNVISRDDLRRALEQQILQIVYRVFRWQDGDYHFSQETSIDYDQEFVTPMSTESILMEGARMLDEWPIIEKRIPHRGVVFVAEAAARAAEVTEEEDEVDALEGLDFDVDKTPAPTTSSRLRVTPLEASVLKLVDGVNTVDDMVRKSANSEFETCKALYGLLTRALIRPATRAEIAFATKRAGLAEAMPQPRTGIPWLTLALLPLLALSVFIAPRNPMNPLFAPGSKLMPRVGAAFSWARLWGVWETLQGHATLVGSFPDTLAELGRSGDVAPEALHDPWGRPYRYILREQSVLLAGSAANGNPDPNLILTRHLASEADIGSGGPGASLVQP